MRERKLKAKAYFFPFGFSFSMGALKTLLLLFYLYSVCILFPMKFWLKSTDQIILGEEICNVGLVQQTNASEPSVWRLHVNP